MKIINAIAIFVCALNVGNAIADQEWWKAAFFVLLALVNVGLYGFQKRLR